MHNLKRESKVKIYLVKLNQYYEHTVSIMGIFFYYIDYKHDYNFILQNFKTFEKKKKEKYISIILF